MHVKCTLQVPKYDQRHKLLLKGDENIKQMLEV